MLQPTSKNDKHWFSKRMYMKYMGISLILYSQNERVKMKILT